MPRDKEFDWKAKSRIYKHIQSMERLSFTRNLLKDDIEKLLLLLYIVSTTLRTIHLSECTGDPIWILFVVYYGIWAEDYSLKKICEPVLTFRYFYLRVLFSRSTDCLAHHIFVYESSTKVLQLMACPLISIQPSKSKAFFLL